YYIHCFFLGLRPNLVSHPKPQASLDTCKHHGNKFFSTFQLHFSARHFLITSSVPHLIRFVSSEKIFLPCVPQCITSIICGV
ncbi:hypothetical protein, partial [Streptococcus pneumoniae]|uniref:hypothetical protein n=1 Tax=Streptococcus pneumoniae TaxID=1313 RepID=UPI001952F2BF